MFLILKFAYVISGRKLDINMFCNALLLQN